MNSPLKKKIEKFSRLDEECQSKIALINSIKQNKVKGAGNNFILNYLMNAQKVEQKPHELTFNTFLNISFDSNPRKTIVIKQKEIMNSMQEDKMFVIKVEADFLINATLSMNWNGYQKKINYKVFGTKAIPIPQYFKDDVKLVMFAQKVKTLAFARLHLDLIKSQFDSSKKINTISPKKQKQEIEEWLKQNRGKSSEILLRRSQTREKLRRQRLIMSAASFKTLSSERTFDPTSSFYNKKQKSEIHLFETQKTKYLNHMKKMSPQKDVLLKKTESEYMSKKQQQVNKMASLILLTKFYQRSRLKLLEKMNARLRRIKVTMLVSDYCMLMKSKLRFKITQKARYRMAIRTPLAFLGEIFYSINKPKAEKTVTDCLGQIETFKTLLKLSEKSVTYMQKLKIIQRYARKKKLNMRERVNIIMNQLMSKNNIKESQLKQKREVLVERYLRICYSQTKSIWTAGLYQKKDILLKMMIN